MSKADLIEVARKMQMDLTAAKAKLAELQRGIAALPDDKPPAENTCPQCGVNVKGKTVVEHLADTHGVDVLEVAQTYAEKWPE